jgi:rhodanese-related sulfurtransferase
MDQAQYYEAKLQYEIDPWDLNEALERGDKIHLVDTRAPEAYGRSHIPGAVNIPHRTMSPATTAHLDKGALIVTYCDGIRCNGSTKGALNMVQLGFRVKELIGGLDCWRYDGYPVDGLEPVQPVARVAVPNQRAFLRTSAGSIRDARLAGTHTAANAATHRTSGAVVNVRTS